MSCYCLLPAISFMFQIMFENLDPDWSMMTSRCSSIDQLTIRVRHWSKLDVPLLVWPETLQESNTPLKSTHL